MEQNMKNIDEFFKEELGSYAELPPPPAWGALERRLDEEKKRRVFPFRWLWFVGVLAILGIAGYSVAWKVSATRDLAAGSALPTEKKYQAAATIPGNTNTATINNQPQVEGANSTGVAKATTAANTKTNHIASTTTKRKYKTHQLALASSRNKKVSKHKEAAPEHITEEQGNIPATTKAERSVSQYPDEDYYEGATASIAPTPVEMSAPAGYTVNKRKKNNMLVADMAPKEEPVAHRYAAASVETEPSYSEPAVTTATQASATHTVRKHTAASRSIAHQSRPAIKTTVTNKQAKAVDNSIAANGSAKATSQNLASQPKRSNTAAIAKVKKAAATNDVTLSSTKDAVAATTPVAATVSKPAAARKAPKPAATATSASKSDAIAATTGTNVSPSAPKGANAKTTDEFNAPKPTASVAAINTKKTAKAKSTDGVTVSLPKDKTSGAIAATVKEKKITEIQASSAQATGSKKIAAAKKHKADAPVATTTTAPTTSVAAATPTVDLASSAPAAKLAATKSVSLSSTKAPAASTPVLASSTPVKKHAKAKAGSEPAATNSIAAAAKQMTGVEAAKTPAAKEITPAAAVASTTAPAKAAIAMKSARKKAAATTSEEIANAESPAAIQPGTELLAATAPKAKHGKKARTAISGKDNAITSVTAIAGTQPAKKAAKHSGKTASVAVTKPAPVTGLNPAADDETGMPAQEISTASAKVAKAIPAKAQPKTAGKGAQPTTNTFASAAKAAKSQPITKTSSPAKASGGNLARFNDEEVPTEDPTINTAANSTLAAAKKEEPVPGTFKEKTQPVEQLPVVQKEKEKSLADSPSIAAKNRKFDLGIKGGVEGSYDGNASRKIVISPYLDYKLNDKFSLMIQPAFKAASLNTRNLGGAQTYYSIDHTDSTLTRTKYNVVFNPWGGTDTQSVTRTYQYSQTHSAITKGYSIGGTYYEFELPLLFKYAVTPKLAMYAGLNINYSRAIRVSEHTYASAPIVVDSAVAVVTGSGQPMAAPPTVSSVLPISGNPVSSYTGPLYATPSTGLFRFGYMAGFSYEFHKNWMVDALVQQGFTKSNVQGGYDVNKPLTLPYIRLTLGYRLTR